MRVNNRGDRVRRIVEPVDEFESKRNQQGDGQQKERVRRRCANAGKIRNKMRPRVNNADAQNNQKNDYANLSGASRQFRVQDRGRRRSHELPPSF